jgi:PIN domain nuclease of toxin-antitoxin system
MRRLLLDTHIWIWLVEDDPRLSFDLSDRIEEVAGNGSIYVSAISLWETCMLMERGRISLSKSPTRWLDEALALPGFSLAPLTPAIALDSAALPGGFRSDPADHLIVATGRVLDAPVVTVDRRIVDYGHSGFVQVLTSLADAP